MSDFGKGYAYCLGLFLAHAEREPRTYWFNGAVDHLLEMEVLNPRVDLFIKKCLEHRNKMEPDEKDVTWAIEEAKEILLQWDLDNNIKAERAEYK